jgi:hypothetical protein
MNTFAGFWRDGALVKLPPKHFNVHNEVIVRNKYDGHIDTWSLNDPQVGIGNHYWLDTTTPTELTPQEAFEVLKVVFPKAKRIMRDAAFAITFDCDGETSIVWGSTTEYPPRERWRVPTDADKGKRCRVKIMTNDFEWKNGVFVFMTTMQPNRFVVSDIGGNVAVFNACEVLE